MLLHDLMELFPDGHSINIWQLTSHSLYWKKKRVINQQWLTSGSCDRSVTACLHFVLLHFIFVLVMAQLHVPTSFSSPALCCQRWRVKLCHGLTGGDGGSKLAKENSVYVCVCADNHRRGDVNLIIKSLYEESDLDLGGKIWVTRGEHYVSWVKIAPRFTWGFRWPHVVAHG